MSQPFDRPLPVPGSYGLPSSIVAPLPPRDRVWLHVVLFALTVVTTTFVGAGQFHFFMQGFDPAARVDPDFRDPWFYIKGFWYSGTILAILGCHEMGHYLASRLYRVDASLPYFLPAPLPLTGTLGAFIRIRQRIPSKVALFDIGIAGPIAGFVVAVPAMFIGLAMSRVERIPAELDSALSLGEPLLFQAAAWLTFGNVADGFSINLHPMAFAAWFGLLATALNLFPIGQLDGGHVAYAVLGRRSAIVTILSVGVAIALTVFSSSWIVWTILMVLMLVAMGPHHPPTLNDEVRLDRQRLIAAGANQPAV